MIQRRLLLLERGVSKRPKLHLRRTEDWGKCTQRHVPGKALRRAPSATCHQREAGTPRPEGSGGEQVRPGDSAQTGGRSIRPSVAPQPPHSPRPVGRAGPPTCSLAPPRPCRRELPGAAPPRLLLIGPHPPPAPSLTGATTNRESQASARNGGCGAAEE